MFFSSWIDSFSSFWSQSNALQLCNTDDVCWNFSRLSFNFKHLFYFFLLISQSQQRWQLLAKKEQTNFCKSMLPFEDPACCHKDGSWWNGIWNLWDRHMVVCRLRPVFFMMDQMLFDSQCLVELTLPAQLWHCGQPSVSLAKCILIYWIPVVKAARNGQKTLNKDAKTGLWSTDNHSVFSKERK